MKEFTSIFGAFIAESGMFMAGVDPMSRTKKEVEDLQGTVWPIAQRVTRRMVKRALSCMSRANSVMQSERGTGEGRTCIVPGVEANIQRH